MPECPVCEAYQPRRLAQPFRCGGCGTELKIAGSTLLAGVLAVIPLIVVLLLVKPWIGKGGVIAVGVIAGHILPWVSFVFFYRLEPTGTALDLNKGPREP